MTAQLERAARLDAVVEGQGLVAHQLVRFVALARDQHHVPCPGPADGALDRAGAVEFHFVLGVHLTQPDFNGVRNGQRILGARVVVREQRKVSEAPDRRALTRAIQGFSIRVAKGLNRMMGRKGRVFDDRYHARVLRTPTEVRHAIRYVLDNARKHAAERGETYPAGYVDPYSSAGAPDLALPAQTWLLREGWRRTQR